MYYEEIWLHDVLHCRGTPNGNWQVVRDPVLVAKAAMRRLTDLQRTEVFGDYCRDCGTPHLPCFCMRDD